MVSGKIVYRRKRASPAGRRRSRDEPVPADDSPEEAVALIAETAATLAQLAQRHRLDMLHHLLAMTLLEAEEHLQLRSRRKLS